MFLKNKLLVAILLLSIFLRFIGLMPNISNSDEGYIQDHSWEIVKNVITKADFDPHSFKYGSWSFYLQALSAFPVLGVTYLSETANTYLSSSFTSRPLSFSAFFDEAVRKYVKTLVFFGRAQTAFFGVASIYIIYLIGKKLFNKRIGLLSALFLSVAPLHVRDSHYITTDVLFVFFILAAFLFAVKVYQDKKLGDFIWLGFFTGFASTIRFFPLTPIFYGLTMIIAFDKSWRSIKKIAISLFFVLLGFFVGLPYLFLDPNGFTLMMQDLEKYVLPWYSTSISNYVFSLITSVVSEGKNLLPDIKMLYSPPHSFRPVHASWIFFNAYGSLPSIFALIGMVVLFFKSFKKFLLLFVTPMLTFVYISAYIPATYERLSLPILPFLAIFTAIFIDYLFNRDRKKDKKKSFLYVSLVLLVLIQPLLIASRASIACGQKSLQYQSSDWVRDNISESAKIGYVTMVSTPPKKYADWFALEPGYNLSLEEALRNGLDHAFVNAGRLDYVTFPFFNGFFIPPKKLYLNSYESLVMSEYQSRATRLGIVEKPWMCDFSRIYYYKLPPKLPEQKKKITEIDFSNKEDFYAFKIFDFDQTGKVYLDWDGQVGKNDAGALIFQEEGFNYSSPRLVYKFQPVKAGEIYTFSAWVKAKDRLDKNPTKLIARMDYYDGDSKLFSAKLKKLYESVKEIFMLMSQGPTPLYFEKIRMSQKFFDDSNLPGREVALSPAIKPSPYWQKISITALAPENSGSVVFSVQPVLTNGSEFYIDDITILSK